MLSSVLFLLLFSGFIIKNNSNFYNKTEKKSDETNETSATHSSYTLRALINSTTASDMSVTESSGNVTITTSNNSATASDKSYLILSTDFSFGSDNIVQIAPDIKTWLVPFDGSDPMQIADLGSGGGGGGSTTCYKQFCPCQSNCGCNNVCQPGTPIQVNGKWCSTYTQNVSDPVCPDGCCIKICKITCPSGSTITATFSGSAYIVRANSLTYNGTTY